MCGIQVTCIHLHAYVHIKLNEFVCFIQLEENVEWLTRVKTLTTPVSAVVSLSDSIVCLSQ